MQFALFGMCNPHYTSYITALCSYKIKRSIPSTKYLQFQFKRRNKRDVKTRLINRRNESQCTNGLTLLHFGDMLAKKGLKLRNFHYLL